MRLFHFVPRHQNQLFIVAIVLLLTMLAAYHASAQSYPSGPTSLSPAVQPVLKVNKRTREVKRKRADVKHSAEYKFYDRVEKAARENKRALRKLSKPQYTNPVYFGHKNLPKRRAVHRMRFCDECGIRH